VINPDGSVEMYFEQLGHWDYYEPILRILIKDNGCTVVEKKDMITDYDVLLKFEDILFYFKHDYMFGNYLYATNATAASILEHLANNVIDNIKINLPAVRDETLK
jgi:hypothetical protein